MPDRQPAAPALPGRGIPLLDIDPELGRDLSPDELETARRYATLPMVTLERGPWSVDQLYAPEIVRGDVHGFMVVDGAMTIAATIASRQCLRLIAAGELVLLDGLEESSLPVSWGWSALTETRLAVLDDRLLAIGTHWPQLLSAALRRAAAQTWQTLLQQAISQLPRVEDRLLALFWVIADRHGVVRQDGVYIGLELTHQTLAEMIGAQRPTVSLGLTRLSEQGLVRVIGNGWLLDPDSADLLPLHLHAGRRRASPGARGSAAPPEDSASEVD